MREILFFLATIFLLSPPAHAQLWKLRRFELTGGLGPTQFYGDIGGFSKGKNLLGLKDFTFRQTRYNFNTSLRYRILDNFSARLNLDAGSFHSTDVRGSNENRDYESRTMFFESSLLAEYCIVRCEEEDDFLFLKGKKSFSFGSLLSMLKVYTFAGVGTLAYNVKPNAGLALRAMPASGFTPVIPAGLGVTLVYSPDLNFGAELGGRYTFSDHIDGYTSPYSKSNDLYYFLNLTLTYKFKTGVSRLASF